MLEHSIKIFAHNESPSKVVHTMQISRYCNTMNHIRFEANWNCFIVWQYQNICTVWTTKHQSLITYFDARKGDAFLRTIIIQAGKNIYCALFIDILATFLWIRKKIKLFGQFLRINKIHKSLVKIRADKLEYSSEG